MARKQLFAIFICMLIPWTAGNGLLPLLPVYASELGASPAVSGYYLGFAYFSLALGTFTAGWISDKFQSRKRPMIIIGFASIPLVWLMGASQDVVQLTILTSSVWFLAGINMTLLNILAGLFAGITERGRVFGILSLAGGLGALVGGLATGPLVDRWGYSGLFIVMGLFFIIQPLTAFFLEDKRVDVSQPDAENPVLETGRLSASFYVFLAASIAAGVALFAGRLGTSLSMRDLQLSSGAISSTGAVGGLVTMPISFYLGLLSDRFGRRRLLAICYFCGAVGVGMLAISTVLWQFLTAASLISIMAYVSPGVGSALVTDRVSPGVLGRGMSYFNATTWLGGIAGFAVAGLAFEQFGLFSTFLMAAMLPIIGALLLGTIWRSQG